MPNRAQPPDGERPLVLMPTYEERENLPEIVAAVLQAQPHVELLVIDDRSPDGTGELADAIARQDARVHVLHRAAKEGLGRAYLAGFAWALASERGYTHVFEMDADFSHDPRFLQPLLDACRAGADLAVGSRYIQGGATPGWSVSRRLLSRGGGWYARGVLGIDVRDLTTGYKCFTRRVLECLPLERVRTSGYGFQIELTYRAIVQGFRVVEVPIVFPERKRGASKMSLAIALEALALVWKLRFGIARTGAASTAARGRPT